MTAPALPRLPIGGRLSTFHLWRLALLIMAAVNLAAFWSLLQYHYSTQNYRTTPVYLGGVERVWTGSASAQR